MNYLNNILKTVQCVWRALTLKYGKLLGSLRFIVWFFVWTGVKLVELFYNSLAIIGDILAFIVILPFAGLAFVTSRCVRAFLPRFERVVSGMTTQEVISLGLEEDEI